MAPVLWVPPLKSQHFPNIHSLCPGTYCTFLQNSRAKSRVVALVSFSFPIYLFSLSPVHYSPLALHPKCSPSAVYTGHSSFLWCPFLPSFLLSPLSSASCCFDFLIFPIQAHTCKGSVTPELFSRYASVIISIYYRQYNFPNDAKGAIKPIDFRQLVHFVCLLHLHFCCFTSSHSFLWC